MAIRTKLVNVGDIHTHPDNPNEGDIGAITESLQFHGQYRAIVVSEATGNIVAGNHTYLAAVALGWSQISAHLLPGLTVDDELRIMLADNQYARKASYDEVSLSELLVQLQATDDALLGTGFDGDDLDLLLADLDMGSEGREGDVVEPPVDPVTNLGDVWQLGDHRLVCGDAADPQAWQLNARFDLLWTDPPYGVSYADKNAFLNSVDKGNRIQTNIESDHQTPDEMLTLWTTAFTAARSHAKPDAAYYTTGPQVGDLLLLLLQAIKASGWQLKHMLIWVKNNHVLGRSDYDYQHEPVLYGWNKKHNWYGGHETSLLQHPKPTVSDLHPTMKPISLIEQCINNSTKHGDLIADPFAGSGSTLIAADNLGRTCHAVEIDPAYCDVIVKRWESLSPDNHATKEQP